MAKQIPFKPRAIDQTIQKNVERFNKPGVLSVRPGYEITGDQLTGKQAIVATVQTKKSKSELAPRDLLPVTVGGYPVDVREASAFQRLRVNDPASAAVGQTFGRPEEKEPVWPFEREMPSGKLMNSATSAMSKAFARSMTAQPATHDAMAAFAAKLEVPGGYMPPRTAPLLQRMQLQGATITAHVSPDAGFKTLTSFLAATKTALVIGMYDFTSGPILQDFLSDLSGTRTLQMVLDNPAPNPTRNQTDWQTVQSLDAKLGGRAKIARALVRTDTFASEWLFPSAYHIKVIVRDGDTLWLSSGNLNPSNQPDLSSPPSTEDRDWHVIIADKDLAQLFSAYLDYDFTEAMKFQAPNPGAIEKAIEDAEAKKGENQNPPPVIPHAPLVNPVAAKTFTNLDVFVTPLLTPDVLPGGQQKQYLTNMMALIQGAQTSIYIQLQYIESSAGDGGFYDLLLQAIASKVAEGKDVRLIESRQYGLKWAEKMMAVGVNLTANIGLQYDVHNKGFVIDSKTVVVSSQNFSPAGVHDNRDAGVIIENADIAQYFEAVFLSDWKTRTIPASTASPSKPTKKPTKTSGKKTGAHKTGRGKKTAPAKKAQRTRKKP